MPLPPADPAFPRGRTSQNPPTRPPILPGQFFGGIDRISRRIAGTPRQLGLMRLIRKEAARLFADYGVGAVGVFRVADAVRLSDSAVASVDMAATVARPQLTCGRLQATLTCDKELPASRVEAAV